MNEPRLIATHIIDERDTAYVFEYKGQRRTIVIPVDLVTEDDWYTDTFGLNMVCEGHYE